MTSAYCRERDHVDDRIFNHEGVPQTQQSVFKISRIFDLIGHRFAASSTIFSVPPMQPKANNVPIWAKFIYHRVVWQRN